MTARKYQEAFVKALINSDVRQEIQLCANDLSASASLTRMQKDWLRLFDWELLDEFARMVTVLRLESSMNALPLTCQLLPEDFVPNFLFDFEKKIPATATDSSPTFEHVKRFADYLRGLLKDGKLTNPLLSDVLDYESTHFLMRNAAGDYSRADETTILPQTDEQLIRVKPIFNDAVKIITFEYDVISAVKSLSAGQSPDIVEKKLTLVFFFSRDKVRIKSISPLIQTILLCCTGQTSIEIIIEGLDRRKALSKHRGSEDIREHLINVFRNLFENGILLRC